MLKKIYIIFKYFSNKMNDEPNETNKLTNNKHGK